MKAVARLAMIGAAACLSASADIARAADAASAPVPGVSLYADPAVPDISGLYLGSLTGIPGVEPAPNRGPADNHPQTYWSPWPLPYTPEYRKIYDDRQSAAAKGRQLGDISARCLPFGMPMMLSTKVYPDEIVQVPGAVMLFMFAIKPIPIWTDGRPHPRDLQPSYYGHSIGHWVGDTLHVDTVGILGTTPLDAMINPHSPALHLQWTIQRVAPDILHFNITLYDEKAFTEPVTTTNIWHRKGGPEWQVLDDQSCFENNRTEIDASGASDGFKKF